MPILYTVMLNRRYDLVFESFYEHQEVSYRQDILDRTPRYRMNYMEELVLNQEANLKLFYNHKGNVILIAVAQSTDAEELNKFVETVYTLATKEANNMRSLNESQDSEQQQEVFQEQNAFGIYQRVGMALTKFTTSWNDNPQNRSKATQLFDALLI